MNPIKHDPPWSPEDHLERVYRRGRQLRRRRQVGITGAALVVAVGLAVSMAGSTSTIVHPIQVLTGTSHGSANNAGAPSTTTTSKPPRTSQVADADNNTPTTLAAGTSGTSTHRSSQTATTAANRSVATDGNTTNTPPTSPLGDCKASDLRYTTTTNKSTYNNGDTVDISLRVRNAGDAPCYAPSACSSGAWATVQNSSGTKVWENSSHLVGCTRPATQPLLNPNDVENYGVVGSWAQNTCPNPSSTDGCDGTRVPVGSYTVTAHRGSVTATPATIGLK